MHYTKWSRNIIETNKITHTSNIWTKEFQRISIEWLINFGQKFNILKNSVTFFTKFWFEKWYNYCRKLPKYYNKYRKLILCYKTSHKIRFKMWSSIDKTLEMNFCWQNGIIPKHIKFYHKQCVSPSTIRTQEMEKRKEAHDDGSIL
jgi:hypothetical protein